MRWKAFGCDPQLATGPIARYALGFITPPEKFTKILQLAQQIPEISPMTPPSILSGLCVPRSVPNLAGAGVSEPTSAGLKSAGAALGVGGQKKRD